MEQIKCSHCHLKFNKELMIKDDIAKDLYFCCNGCQGVYHLLKDDGLDSFYDKLGNNTILPPLQSNNDLSKYDLDTFEKRYIKITKNGFKQIDLIIEGIHCAACVWLNEKILYNCDGIKDVTINFTNYKAKIIWDDKKIKLSSIIQKIQSIGYNAYPYNQTISDTRATKNKREYFIKMMVAVFASMNIMMLDVAKYTGFFTGITKDVLWLVHLGEFILTTPVLFYSGSIFYRTAYYGLKNKIINMDFLVIFGASLTYIYSIFVFLGILKGDSYFDSATMIITFVLVGKYLEVIGKKSAVDTLDKIKSQIPTEAMIVQNGIKKLVSPEEIVVNDTIEIKAGEKASVDGIVISGTSSFDESNISGESKSITKNINDKIISGSINIDTVLRYKATKDYEHSTLNNILNIIEDSLSSKSDIENRTNEISKYFSISILLISIASFFGWYILNDSFENALIIAISVIIIACPCALALATPIASLIGISKLAKDGLLFKEAKYIELFAKASVLVVDKTGTITNGKLAVVDAKVDMLSSLELNILYSLVDLSSHPVSIAIKKYLENLKDLELNQIELLNIKQIPSVGINAKYNNLKVFGGKLDNNKQYESTIYHFVINNKLITTFYLEDTIKKNAKNIVKYLQGLNIKVIMCTGDNEIVAKKVSDSIGLDEFKANMNPLEKTRYIKELQNNSQVVVFAGDGINDAPALAQADISIAMGNGADISIAISDVVVLNNSLDSIKKCFLISKKIYSLIKQNLLISLIYNIITIPLAIFGYVIPLVAALSMSISSLLVVGNSMRINKK